MDRQTALNIVVDYLKPGPWDLWKGEDEKVNIQKFKEALTILIPELDGKLTNKIPTSAE